MINGIDKTVVIKIKSSITCDVCKKTFDDQFEWAEFTEIDFCGGYYSIFNDGCRYKCDICQYCLKTILGQYLRKVE